ncbi:MAG: LlaMI family restriction endonuclease [Candidatus Peribacteraceae bacterium]|nr:LlaMI family restriction endonuclease [Candidatus Peribacteraceae bacterium]
MKNNNHKAGRQLQKMKKLIVQRFIKMVKGKKPDTSASHKRHDGKEGHWLETQMGIRHNASNAPDLYGFEMKNQTGSKTTFGDWSADHYIFKDKSSGISRDEFLGIFGMPNLEKGMRCSWSGKPCPKVGHYNSCGQTLLIDSKNNILAVYNFQKDTRQNKAIIVPKSMQKKRLVIAKWEASTMRRKVEKKFNMSGWFQCKKDTSGCYSEIVFGEPINFDNWIDGVRKGLIFFDSGMYQGNKRPYSQWRADNRYWEALITSRF